MSAEEQMMFQKQYEKKSKNTGIMVLLAIIFPIQLFLLGRTGLGIAFLFTLPFGVGILWWIIEWFLTPKRVREYNGDIATKILTDMKLLNLYMSKPKCPCCGGVLKKQPQRKIKCPSCGEYIYVKSTPDNRDRRMMTKSEAQDAEIKWSEYHEQKRILSVLQEFGITEKNLEKEQRRFSSRKPLREVYSILLKRVAEKHKDFSCRSRAHHQIALDLSKENGNFLPHLKEVAKYELLRLKFFMENSSIVDSSKVKISAGHSGVCNQCKKQDNLILDINEALSSMPIPCKSCSNRDGFCRCWYVNIIDKEYD